MIHVKKLLGLALAGIATAQLAACGGRPGGGGGSSLFYPDYGYATADTDSWLQIEDIDEEVKVDWYIDSTRIATIPYLTQHISDMFNITINWRLPADDNGTTLSTMIAGDTLSDIITINDYTTRIQLEGNGYVYPFQVLAEKYAPTLLGRIPEDMSDYYAASDGNMYCWPNNYYSDEDLAEFSELGGKLLAVCGILCRKDYLEGYLSAYPEKENGALTPSEYIEMCLWVKEHYGLSNTNPTVMLEPRNGDSDEGTRAIACLMEFFNVAPENADGSYAYRQADEKYKEMLMFLNEMYRSKLITSGNLTADFSTSTSYVLQGLPFSIIGYPTDYQQYFRTLYNNSGVEYVPVMLTNAEGETPLLRDVGGRGFRLTMITKNCSHPERIIKMFDYLASEEGQRALYFGDENEDFVWAADDEGTKILPGTTLTVNVGGQDIRHTYRYGQIKWTDKAWGYLKNNTFTTNGVRIYSMLQNPMYPILAGADGNGYGLSLQKEYIWYNQEAPYMPYTYRYQDFCYNLDVNDGDYYDMLDIRQDLIEHWQTETAKIIICTTAELAEKKYNDALSMAESIGYKEYAAFENKYFQAFKAKNGIAFAYPKNRADYLPLAVTSVYGDRSYCVTMPSQLA